MTAFVIPDISRQPQAPVTYNGLGPVKPWVGAAAQFLGHMFGIKSIGGVRSDPLPDHPSGHALDFMCDIPTGNALADYAVANYQALGVKYIIHNRMVWNPAKGWHPYEAPASVGYNPHTDHVHITFNDSPGSAFVNGTLDGSAFVAPSGSGMTLAADTSSTDDTCAWHLKAAVFDTCVISKVGMRQMFGAAWIAAGIGIGMIAAIILVYAAKDTSGGNAVTKSAGAVTDVAGKAALMLL